MQPPEVDPAYRLAARRAAEAAAAARDRADAEVEARFNPVHAERRSRHRAHLRVDEAAETVCGLPVLFAGGDPRRPVAGVKVCAACARHVRTVHAELLVAYTRNAEESPR